MNYLDIIFIIPLLWFSVKGFRQGFIVAIATLVALILGIYLANHFSIFVSEFMQNDLHISNKYMNIISFVVTFIIIILLVILLGKSIEKIVKAGNLGFFNRLAGALFGIFKMALIISTLLMILNTLSLEDVVIGKKNKESSLLYKPIQRIAPLVFPKIKDYKNRIQDRFEDHQTDTLKSSN